MCCGLLSLGCQIRSNLKLIEVSGEVVESIRSHLRDRVPRHFPLQPVETRAILGQRNSMEDGGPCVPEVREEVAKDERNGENGEEEKALLFLDSLDGYLMLLDSLSSTLRQGWLELASARHSMGSSRVSSTLLDLKEQSAATTVLLEELDEGSPSVSQPHFTLSKWASLKEGKSSPKEIVHSELIKDHDGSQLRHRGSKHVSEGTQETSSATTQSSAADENFQRQRYKSLSVFGALVSPKLRSAQVSFETALEIIAEVANMQSSMLSSFSQLQKDEKCSD